MHSFDSHPAPAKVFLLWVLPVLSALFAVSAACTAFLYRRSGTEFLFFRFAQLCGLAFLFVLLAVFTHLLLRGGRFFRTCLQLAAVWACGWLAYRAVAALLPTGLEFRAWFSTSAKLTLWNSAGALLLGMVIYGIYAEQLHPRKAEGGARRLAGGFLSVLGTLLAVVLVLLLLLGSWWIWGGGDDETLQPDGTLAVTIHNAWNSESFTRTPVGLFFRRGPAVTGGDDTGASSAPQAVSEAASSEMVASSAASHEKGEGIDASTDGGYAAILRACYPADAADAVYTVSAKGVPYVIVSSEGNTRIRLVYDRLSANGACRLYVCYQDSMATDTQGGFYAESSSILDFYAYNTVTGAVTSAEKTTWDGPGTAEWQAETGE